ncbi:MAG: hypothetical protein H8K05_22090, partial [Nitrospira sp.]|nr:hypothetical protein [Nitrospira sp.]
MMRSSYPLPAWIVMCFILAGAMGPRSAFPQTVTPFQLVGHIQRFTLDSPADPLSGATLTVNGVDVILPKNLVIQLPAAYF